MRSVKRTLNFVFILILAMALAACSGGKVADDSAGQEPAASKGEGSTSDSEPVTIRLMHGWTGEVPMAAAFEPGIDQFVQDHPEIDLKVETAPGNAIKEKVLTEMAANNPPDVFLHWGTRSTEPYIENGKLAVLDDLINGDPDFEGRFIPEAYDLSTYQGKIYGLPMEAYMHYFIVNKTLFEEHNVMIPETYEDLKAAVQTFVQKGLIPFAANNHSARYMLTIWNNQLMDRDEVLQASAGSGQFGDPMLKAAQHIDELVKMKAFPEGLATMDTLQSLELFNSEKSPMYYQHTWTIGNINPDLLDNVAVVPFPKVDDDGAEDMMTANVGYFVYMSQAAYDDPDKREAAWEVMKYLSGSEIAKDMVEQVSNPSPVVLDYEGITLSPVLEASIALRDSSEIISPNIEEYMSQEASDEFWTLFDRLSLGDIDPQSFVDDLNDTLRENPNKAIQ